MLNKTIEIVEYFLVEAPKANAVIIEHGMRGALYAATEMYEFHAKPDESGVNYFQKYFPDLPNASARADLINYMVDGSLPSIDFFGEVGFQEQMRYNERIEKAGNLILIANGITIQPKGQTIEAKQD